MTEKKPETDKMYLDDGVKKAIEYAADKNVPVLLVGETGTGKTAAIRDVAHRLGKQLFRINLTGQTGVDEFVGKTLLRKDGNSTVTFWQDGVVIKAMREGHWIVLDEINMAAPDILAKLHSLLDDDRFITLVEKDGEVVRPHADFRLFATMNPPEDYVGTKDLNKALMSRFPVILNVDYSDQEAKIVQERTGVDALVAEELVMVATELRKNKKSGAINFIPSTRDLIYCGGLITAGFPKKEAMILSMVNKAAPEERTPIMKVVGLVTDKEGLDIPKKYAGLPVLELIQKASETFKLNTKLQKENIEYRKQISDLEAAGGKMTVADVAKFEELKKKIEKLELAGIKI